MSYRSLTVDGKTYEYSIGRSHVKFRGGPAVSYIEDDSPLKVICAVDDHTVQVTPAALIEYIRQHLAK